MSKTRIALAAVVAVLVLAYFGASAYMKHRTVQHLNDFAVYTGLGGKVDHGKIKTNPITGNGVVEGLSITKEGLRVTVHTLFYNARSLAATAEGVRIEGPFQKADIEKIVLNKYVLESGVPKSTDVDIHSLRLAVPSLAKDGNDNITMNISIATEADFEKETYEYTKFNIDAPELMNLDLKLMLSGFDLRKYAAFSGMSSEELDKNEEFKKQVAEDIGNVSLNNMVINFKDKGLITRYYKSAAVEAGLSDDEFKKEVTETFEKLINESESEFDKTFAENTKKFALGEYSEAILTFTPEEPINIQTIAFSAMMGATSEQLAKMIGFNYTVK